MRRSCCQACTTMRVLPGFEGLRSRPDVVVLQVRKARAFSCILLTPQVLQNARKQYNCLSSNLSQGGNGLLAKQYNQVLVIAPHVHKHDQLQTKTFNKTLASPKACSILEA
jgi:hypothetical protein